MGNRIILLIVAFLHLCISFSFADQVDDKPAIVKVRNIGRSDFINIVSLDLDDENKFLLNSVSQEDKISHAFFQAYIFTDKLNELVIFFNDIKDKSLKEKLLYEIFSVSIKKGKLKEFKESFGSIIEKEEFEKIRFLLSFKEGNLDKVNFKSQYFHALLDAYQFAEKGDYVTASEKIKMFSHKFPRTYFFFMINANMYKEALEFISNTNLNNKDFFEALIYYYQGDCSKALEKLSAPFISFGEKLLYIECSPNINASFFDTNNNEVSGVPDDPFLIFFKLDKDLTQNPELIQPYKIFYYSFKLKNLFQGLSIYKDEIEKFVNKINNINAELKDILTKYDTVWTEIERTGNDKDIRRKIIDIQENTRGIKEVSFNSSVDSKKIFTFFDEQIANAKDIIRSVYLDFEKKQQRESFILKKEVEIRNYLNQNVYSKQKFNKDDYDNLLIQLNKYYEISVNEKLSLEEDIAYAIISVLWDISQNADLADKEKIWQELVKESEKYLKKYKERQKEVMLILAESLEGIGDPKGALATYKDYLYIEDNPNARTLMKIGELYFDVADYINAIEFFNKASQKSQNYRNAAYYKIGWSYYLLGRLTEVADLFLNYDFKEESEKGILLFDEMMELLSRVFFKLGEEKIPIFLAKYPNFGIPEKLYKGVGDLHLFIADYDKALSVYEKGLNDYYLYKYSNELLAARIELFNLLGKNDIAYEEKFKFLNLYSINSEYYRKFKTLPKEYKDTLYTTAVFYNVRFDKNGNEDDYKRSEQLYNRFLKYFPDDEHIGEVAYLLAQLEEIKKNYVSSAEHFTFAWQKGFRPEDSLYRALFSQYKMWQNKKLSGYELIDALKKYVKTYPDYEKTISAVIVLSDMLLKEGRETELIEILDLASVSADEKKLIKILDFCETNFKQIKDKKSLSMFFNRGFEKLKDNRYLELKHYALFSEAKAYEESEKLIEAKVLYKTIIEDNTPTSFKEFALFNLALILEKEGSINEAVLNMQQIKQKKELAEKAKDFIFTFGKKNGLYLEAAEAAIDLAKTDPPNLTFYYLEAAWLFIKGKNIKKAEDILNILSKISKNDKEVIDYTLLKGIVENKNGKFILAFDSFTYAINGASKVEYDEEFISCFHETLKNTIFLKPEEEARTAIESFIGFLGNRFKATGNPEYLYNIAEALSDFSVFFLQKDEAVKKAIDFYKRSLSLAVKNKKADLVIKNILKLKELKPDPYARELEVMELKVNFLEDIEYEELFTE